MIQSGVEQSYVLNEELGNICLTQLYGRIALPGDSQPHRVHHVHVILHEGMGKVLRIWKNPYHENQYPYFPVRYKRLMRSSWGIGAGDEVIYAQSADSALLNLSIANVQNGAFNIHQVASGSMAALQMSRLAPNEVIVTDRPGEDFVSHQLGGQAQGIAETVEDVRYRARSSTGLASVLQGAGDPTLKSGASAGQTSLLAQQAGKKFGRVDQQIREDIDDYFMFCLELVAQYAPNGLFYTHLDDPAAERARVLRWM